VALDITLRLREETRRAGEGLLALLAALMQLSAAHLVTLLPGYTHRQRAIPITVGHWAAAALAALLRDGELLGYFLSHFDRCPLGAGALAGSSLPLQRAYVAGLLGFAAPTDNSLDTVGDRDGTADLCYLSCRLHGHMSRIATDIIDFASREFGFVRLGDAIAGGSSMMPHKKNPDVFELVRGRAARAQGDLAAALTLTKGLPLGYQRDLQEDRAMLLGLGEHLRGTLELLTLGLRHISFHEEATLLALRGDATQATDLAEVLVARGLPFRQAYRVIGGLVARSRERGLLSLTDEELLLALPDELRRNDGDSIVAALRQRLDPRLCVQARSLPGGPAPSSVQAQLLAFEQRIELLRQQVKSVIPLALLRQRLEAELL
jgi:argininosuccinate lyase